MPNSFDYDLEKMHELETENIKILYYDLQKNYSGHYRSYQYARFCTILKGEKKVTLNNNQQFTYSKDNYLLLAPNTKVHMDINENTQALVFELNNDLVYKVLSKVDLSEQIKEKIKITDNFFLGDNRFNISEDIQNIFTLSKSDEKNKLFLIDLYAQKLVVDLIKNKAVYHILQSKASIPLQLVFQYIDDHIHTKINLKKLSNDLNMSLSNLSHMFKKHTGMRLVDYIKNKKLELAVQYLREQSVTDVAFELGYENISYFIRLFKEKYKITPKQYKMKFL